MTSLDLRVVDKVEEFAALRAAWNHALALSQEQHVFLTWEWVFTWWRHFGQGKRLNILLVEEDERVLAIAPLMRTRRGFGPSAVETLDNISHDMGDYGGVILTERAEEALALIAGYLEEEVDQNNAVVNITRVPEDSRLVGLLPSFAAVPPVRMAFQQRTAFTCPYYPVEGGKSLDSLPNSTLRKSHKRLQRDYELSFKLYVNDGLDEALETVIGLHEKRWEQKGSDMQGLIADASHRSFTADVVKALGQERWVHLSLLKANGAPISGMLGFNFGGRLYLMKGGFDPDYAYYAPGHLHLFYLLKEFASYNLKEFDFLRGNEPYKKLWTTAERRVVSLRLMRPGMAGKMRVNWDRVLRKLGMPASAPKGPAAGICQKVKAVPASLTVKETNSSSVHRG